MKKSIAFIIAIVLIVAFCGCGSLSKPDDLSGTWVAKRTEALENLQREDHKVDMTLTITNPAEGEETGTVKIVDTATNIVFEQNSEYLDAILSYMDYVAKRIEAGEYDNLTEAEYIEENYPDLYSTRHEETISAVDWIGTYVPMSEASNSYSWISDNLDKEGNESVNLYFDGDDQATFTYKDGKIVLESNVDGLVYNFIFEKAD